jgi:hypothetical protein
MGGIDATTRHANAARRGASRIAPDLRAATASIRRLNRSDRSATDATGVHVPGTTGQLGSRRTLVRRPQCRRLNRYRLLVVNADPSRRDQQR